MKRNPAQNSGGGDARLHQDSSCERLIVFQHALEVNVELAHEALKKEGSARSPLSSCWIRMNVAQNSGTTVIANM